MSAAGTVARWLGVATGYSVRVGGWPIRKVRGALGKQRTSPGGAASTIVGGPSRSRTKRDPHIEAAHVAAQEGLDNLARTLSDRDPTVRVLALEIIADFSEDRAERLLRAMLQDPEPRVRVAAADAAARVKATGVVFALILGLDQDDQEVREACARAISAMSERTVAPADVDERARKAQVRELMAWWKQRRVAQISAKIEEAS